jgi:arylformamidase
MDDKLFDISVPLKSGMVHWPGDPDVIIKRNSDMNEGEDANTSIISMSNHTGTHMDAPLHFIKGGMSLDDLPLEAVIGKARLIEVADTDVIEAKHLEEKGISAGERIIIKTRNSDIKWWEMDFLDKYVYLSEDAAAYLADKKIRTLGVDYLSIGGKDINTKETHDHILGAGIWVIEGLKLDEVMPGNYELIALPLKLVNGDGAPCRVVLRSN